MAAAPGVDAVAGSAGHVEAAPPWAATGLPDTEPAWGHVLTPGWWPTHEGEIWPLWPALGQAGSDVLHPILGAWVLLLAVVPALALLVDRLLGEPAPRWHPVVWMGHWLAHWGPRVAPRWQGASSAAVDGRAWWRGTLAWWGGALLVLGAALFVQTLVLHMPMPIALPVLALTLKPLLSWAMLHDEVMAVERALAQSLDAGRVQLSRLVSRDTRTLSETEVRESAIETLAENLCDSLVAPLFWFALLGLPGAALYRFANTADAMWGYRGERGGRDWTWAGHWAARVDDVLNWVPARLTAVLLMLGAPAMQWQQLRQEAGKTPSPNGGWPMGAMALRLGVCLRKPGSYRLHETGALPQAADTLHAARRAGRVAALGTALASLAVLAQLVAGGF